MVFTTCNICGSDRYREVCDIEISPFATPSRLVRCSECGFSYANPKLDKMLDEDHYRKHYHEREAEEFWYKIRIHFFRRSLREINRFLKKGRLIDVGCGMGYFMDLARNDGWKVKGVEISDYAVSYGQDKLKLDIIKGGLKEARFETGYFDAAIMWNTLDEIDDPKANLIELNRILRKGGYIFIRVPNLYFHLRLSRLYNRRRQLFTDIGYNPSVFHLYSFDKNSIKNLLEKAGFSNVIVKTEPISPDARCFAMIFGKKKKAVKRLVDLIAMIVYFLTLGKIIISPSIFVIARKG
jgi:SAM-dependent methyltransferase